MQFFIFLGVVGTVSWLLDAHYINWAMAVVGGYAVFFMVNRWITAKYYDVVDEDDLDD